MLPPLRTLLLIRTLLVIVGAAALVAAASAPPLFVGTFSREAPRGLPAGWEVQTLPNVPPTQYALVRVDGTVALRAESERAASGLVRRLDADPNEFPVLVWRWRVENVIEGGSMARRSGDDYPARIYVTFDYDPANLSLADRARHRALRALGFRDVPLRALTYVWANQPGETRPARSPFTDWVEMIPVESGPARVGQWREYRRNIVEDYRRAFGEDPPRITGVSIMTDTDNTRGRAVAYYGDIRLERR